MKNVFGVLGIVLVQCCYIPQTVEILMTGNVAGISVSMFVILTLGLSSFAVHSVWTRNHLYTVSNAIGLINTATVLFLLILKG